MSLLARLLLSLSLASAAFAQPAISSAGIVNAASSLPPGLPGGALGQGSLFVVYGSGLGPGTLQLGAFPLTTTLAGTSVSVTIGGVTTNALIVYTSNTQLAALLPSSTPTGTGTLSVSYNGQTSTTATVRVRTSSFGLFTLNQQGSGPIVAQNYESATSLPVNSVLQPARPGQTVILYGTGLGPVTFPENAPAQVQPVDVPVQVSIGGKSATVSYAGRSGCCAGLDQINIVVPDGVASCFAPVYVRAGSVTSNFGTISIATGAGPCSDTPGLQASDFANMTNNLPTHLGIIGLTRTFNQGRYQEVGTGGFYTAMPAQMLTMPNPLDTIPVGSCSMTVGIHSLLEGFPKGDAGARLTVSGGKATGTADKFSSLTYSGLLSNGAAPSVITDGPLTVDNGTGGPDVGAFKANSGAGAAVTWTNASSISMVNRAQGLRVTWSGGDPNGLVRIQGSVNASESSDVPGEYQSFMCLQRASAGEFTVPPAVLQALPPIAAGGGSLYVGTQALSPKFTATGLEAGFIKTLLWTGVAMGYQ